MEHKMPTVTRRLIDPQRLKALSQPKIGRWLWHVATEWSVIAATLTVCLIWPQWWVWLIAIPVIGTRQHALAILGHEGTHGLITRSRRLNDELANFATCYPLLFTVQGFRASHFEHHWYLETSKDPSKVTVDKQPADWSFPVSRWRFVSMFLRDLSGLSQASSAALLKYLWHIPDRRLHLLRIALMHTLAWGVLIYNGHWLAYPVLWLIPLFTVTVACYRIRAIAEHSGFGDPAMRYRRTEIDPLLVTRTSVQQPLVAWILAPYNVSYHIEHHLYPSVPTFNLKALHAELSRSPVYQRHAHITRGYSGLIAELTALPG